MPRSRSEVWREWEASRKAIKPVPSKAAAVPLLPLCPLIPPLLLAAIAVEARHHSEGC